MNSRLFPHLSSPLSKTLGSHSPESTDAVQPASVLSAIGVVSPGLSNPTSSPSSGTSLEDSLIEMRREGWSELVRLLNRNLKTEVGHFSVSLNNKSANTLTYCILG